MFVYNQIKGEITMKKILGICLLCISLTGCTKENENARTRIAIKNAKSVISAIKMNYILDQTSIPIGEPISVMSLSNMKVSIKDGTYTILSEQAESDESQIRLDNVIIDDHTCTGTKDDMKCIES